jgi:hypothetical protein
MLLFSLERTAWRYWFLHGEFLSIVLLMDGGGGQCR